MATRTIVSTLAIGDRDHRAELVDLLEVGRRPGHQLAGLGAVVEREVELLEIGEHRLAEVRLDAKETLKAWYRRIPEHAEESAPRTRMAAA